MNQYANSLENAHHDGRPPFVIGQRVQAHPNTDAWMRGDRFGTVERVGRAYVHVRMDRSECLIAFHAFDLLEVQP